MDLWDHLQESIYNFLVFKVTSPSDFGNGWETGDTMCTPDPGPIDPCSEDSNINLAAQDLCYILIYVDGKLRQYIS